ncbi:IS630 family transposase [Salinibacter ruber]|uniref:IS630 family transposase n=1 Tax=Salinibacter ruber TaxID=146919 RepID=UPI000E57C019|nr:IS630 family transposase [Salinibacter ruber]
MDFQERLPECLANLKAGADRPVRLFCQDECRIGLMPITRRRITLPGVKPIQTAKPGYEYFYLYGAVEPETGQRFFTEHERLNSNCFQVFLNRFTEAFPQSHNVLVLDNGQFHKAKKLSIPKNVELMFLPSYSPELNPVERLWQDLKDQLAFDFYKHLSDLRQETRLVLRSYTNEVVRSLTGYEYLVEATSVLSS